MKTTVLPLLALTAGEAAAQYFVLYGRDVVTARIDPILDPGTIGMHMHNFMGAGNVDENSNFKSLRQANCTSMGRANGNPINEDRSIYWHPALYVKALNGTYIRVPTNGHQIYYENSGTGTMRNPFEFPEGFRMISGGQYLRAPRLHTPTNYDNITQWICHESVWNEGDRGGFPNGVSSCPDYPFFNGAIHFPHCWNGNGFNAAAPQAHMSFPTGDVQNGPCPASHPIRLPHILMENNFDLTSILGQFQPNTFVLSQGDPTGFGWHADFFNGWKTGVLHNLLNGTNSCYSHDVGDCFGVTFDTSMNVAQCTTENPYPEDADGPLAALPGCNPITSNSPAPACKACSAGVVGGQCVLKSTAASTAATKSSSTSLSVYASSIVSSASSADTVNNNVKTSTSSSKKSTTSSSTTTKKKTTSAAAKTTSAARVVVTPTITKTVTSTRWTTRTVTSTVTNAGMVKMMKARVKVAAAVANARAGVVGSSTSKSKGKRDGEDGELIGTVDEEEVREAWRRGLGHSRGAHGHGRRDF